MSSRFPVVLAAGRYSALQHMWAQLFKFGVQFFRIEGNPWLWLR
jgi:hypothetical protein